MAAAEEHFIEVEHEEAPKAPARKAPVKPKTEVQVVEKVVERVVEKVVEKVVHVIHHLPGELSLEDQAKRRNLN